MRNVNIQFVGTCGRKGDMGDVVQVEIRVGITDVFGGGGLMFTIPEVGFGYAQTSFSPISSMLVK